MGKKSITKKKRQLLHRHTRSQSGGIKVLLPGMHNPVMEREIKDIDKLRTILSNTINIEIVSTDSLYSFVLRLHLNPATILFRSDKLTSKKELFSRQYKSLSYSELDNETDGLPIHEIIIKICLIDPVRRNITLNDFNGINKAWTTKEKLVNEYNTQRYLYSSMMSISGSPFCPDAFGIVILNPPTHINILAAVPNITKILESDKKLKDINDYINKHGSLGFSVGIIIMESIPPSYKPIYDYRIEKQYKKLCEGVAAINILSIYRGKMFTLDAHTYNWLCNLSAPILQQVKQIDFGIVYRLDTYPNLKYFIDDIKKYIGIYFLKNITNETDRTDRINLLNRFYIMMGVKGSELTIYTLQPNLDFKIEYAKVVFEKEINNIITIFRTVDLFSKPYIEMSDDERRMNIKMIHRLILISSLVDSFHNCAKCNLEKAQISGIYSVILNIAAVNPINILSYPISLDLDSYNLIHPDRAVELKEKYRRIYDIIYEYCKENKFPHIRNYERFMEIHRTRAENAWLKLKHIRATIGLYSSMVREKVGKYSSVVGTALSYIPGSSHVSNLAHGVYDKALDINYNVKSKSSNALRKLKSMVSSDPYEPVKPPSPARRTSPRATIRPIEPIPPLVYGGRNTRKHRHTKKH
jgi:hypothetical protein